MPLTDHFHPPLFPRRHWESFHVTWAGAIADALNEDLLPDGYFAEKHAHAGARVEIDVAPEVRGVSVATAEVLLRCAQESITNALRHGAAQRISVKLTRIAKSVQLSVRDDGRGSASLTPGNGLTGMRERVEALGGELGLDSSPRSGTEVCISIPYSSDSGRSP